MVCADSLGLDSKQYYVKSWLDIIFASSAAVKQTLSQLSDVSHTDKTAVGCAQPAMFAHSQVHPRSRCPRPGEEVWSDMPSRGRQGGGRSQRRGEGRLESRRIDSARR